MVPRCASSSSASWTTSRSPCSDPRPAPAGPSASGRPARGPLGGRTVEAPPRVASRSARLHVADRVAELLVGDVRVHVDPDVAGIVLTLRPPHLHAVRVPGV